MRSLTVTYSFRDNRSVPMIRLRGKWLANAGFDEGIRVRVEVKEGALVLTRISEEMPADASSTPVQMIRPTRDRGRFSWTKVSARNVLNEGLTSTDCLRIVIN